MFLFAPIILFIEIFVTAPPRINFPQRTIYRAVTQVSPSPSITPTNTPTPIPTYIPTPPITLTPAPTNKPVIKLNSNSSTTASNILTALNNYRAKKGVGTLSWSQILASFAQSRANYFASIGSPAGGLDNHAGFNNYIADDGFNKLGFWALGENSSQGFTGSPTELIEQFYGGHKPHDDNQLKSDWSHVGIGVNGLFTDLVFGGRKK